VTEAATDRGLPPMIEPIDVWSLSPHPQLFLGIETTQLLNGLYTFR
jgi:hypothetical protein